MIFVGKVLSYSLFYIVLTAVIFSYWRSRVKAKADGETEMLGRAAAKELKGIAILMVLLGHLTYMFGFAFLPVTPALGAPAVDIFLFLSAFGLMSSYMKKGLKGFAGRRLAVILIPYIITTIFKFFLPMQEVNFTIIWKNILPLYSDISESVDSSMWFVQYILLCYAVFFLVFAIPKLGTKWKVIILSVIGLGLAIYNGSLYYKEEIPYMASLSESYSHHLSFPLGAVFFLIYEKAKKMSYKIYIGIAAICFIVFQFIVFPGVDGYVKYYINNLLYVIFFIAVFAVIKHFGLCSRLLQWLGDLSYYIYLNELMVMSIFYLYVPLPEGIRGLLVIITSVALAVPVRLLSEWMLKKINVR